MYQLFPRNRRPTFAQRSVIGITACKLAIYALLLRAGYIQPYVSSNALHIYLPAASHILKEGTYDDRDTLLYSMEAPGYSFLIAFLEEITASYYLALLVCLQIVLDCGVALLLLSLGERFELRRGGFLAGVLWLLFPPAAIGSVWIVSETLFTAGLVFSIVMWLRSLSPKQPAGWAFGAGLALGVTALVRATTQLLAPFLCLTFIFQRLPKWKWRGALLLAGACCAIVPWMLRDLSTFGEPIIQIGFGAVLLQGSRSEYFTASGKTSRYPALFRQAAQEGLPQPAETSGAERDAWLVRLGLRSYRVRWRRRPLSFLPFLAHKFARLWYGVESGSFYKQLALGLCSLAVLPFAMFQIWLWRRDQPLLSITLSSLLLYFVMLHLIGYPEFRYMIPIYPFLIFAAANQYLTIARTIFGGSTHKSTATASSP